MPSTPRPESRPGAIRVGVAGWAYQDWVGRVYPARGGRGFDRLRWIARFLDLVEINVSFYRIPGPATSRAWVERLEGLTDFRFTAKLHQSFTHQRRLEDESLEAMHRFLLPLRAAGRLEGLLAQFPWSFRPSGPAVSHIAALRERFPLDPLDVEVRHGAWGRDDWADRLRATGVGLAGIDQPRVGDSLGSWSGPGVGTLRLHGRNAAAWFDPAAGRDERYNYLYRPEELDEWIGRSQATAAVTPQVRVVTNNHFRGQAVANALEIRAGLGQPVAEVPEPLVRSIPSLLARLRARGADPRLVAAPAPPGAQPGLFD